MKPSHALLSVISLFLLASCGPAKQYQAPIVSALDNTGSRTVTVHADGDWQGTGLRVQSGDIYDLKATGRWSNGPLICGWTEADGIGASPLCRNDISGLGLTTHALIGKIGPGGKPFYVGKNLRLAPASSGVLYLKDYDDPNFYADNEGSIAVTITRIAVQMRTAAPKAAPQPALPSTTQSMSKVREAVRFDDTPVTVSFPQSAMHPDDIAVIIGNADYGKLGRDIPNVDPAYADATGVKQYATQALGIREGNIIELKDATGAQLQRIFGTQANPQGQLYDWVRPGKSKVFVYYAGHGAPAGKDGSAYLVPSDSDAARVNINGYPLSLLYANLAKLPSPSITVVLEACFSGASQAGSVITKASPIFIKPKTPTVPAKLTVIAAGAPDQMASWEQNAKHSLFTKYFLKAMSGEADAKPYGNGDGNISTEELNAYLRDTLTYYARRYYGRDQTAVVAGRGF